MCAFFSRKNLLIFLIASTIFAIALILFTFNALMEKNAAIAGTGQVSGLAQGAKAGTIPETAKCFEEKCTFDENCPVQCIKTLKEKMPVVLSGAENFSEGIKYNMDFENNAVELAKKTGKKCAESGAFLSPVYDAAREIDFGNIEWKIIEDGNISVQTRTGNSEKPDLNWSIWSENYYDGIAEKAAIDGNIARFIQFKIIMGNNASCPKLGFVKFGAIEQIEISSVKTIENKLSANLVETNFESRYGINNHLYTQTLQQLSRAGFGWTRDDMPWQETETSKGKLAIPKRIDDYLNTAKIYGINVLPVISYGTNWWKLDGFDPKLFGEFAGFVAEKYKFTYYEIWNEENFERFWLQWFNEQPNPKRYAKILKEASKSIKEKVPDAKIIMGGTANIDKEYIEAVLKENTAGYIDAISFHPYKTGCPIEEYYLEFNELQSMVKKYSDKKIEYWITEVGYRTKNKNSVYGLGELTQAKMLARAFIFTLDLPIEKIFWYDSIDLPEKNDADNQYGLLNESHSPKIAYDIAQNLTRLLKNGLPADKKVSSIIKNIQVHLYGIENKLYLSTWYFYDCNKANGIKDAMPLKATIKIDSLEYLMPMEINLLNGKKQAMYYTQKGDSIYLDVVLSDMPKLIELTKSTTAYDN